MGKFFDLVKAVSLLLASVCAWYLGYLFAESLPDTTLTSAINNIQSIGEKTIIRAPPPRRQKCDHWTSCPADSYAIRLVSGGGNMKLPKICFEDEMLIGEKKGNAGRGLNIAIVDYGTGKVINTKTFDTYENEVSGEVVKCLKDAPHKAIILIASHDEAATKLREEVKKALEELGSKEIRNLRFRTCWLFIAKKGGNLPSGFEQEKINHSDDRKNRYNGWPAEIQIDGCIPKSEN